YLSVSTVPIAVSSGWRDGSRSRAGVDAPVMSRPYNTGETAQRRTGERGPGPASRPGPHGARRQTRTKHVCETLLTNLLGLALLGAVSCAGTTQSAPPPQGWVVQLPPATGAPAMGQATIHENGRQWMVMIAIQGLEPNRPTVANVRNGSCAGPVLYPLTALTVNATGYGYSDTDL